MCCYTLIRSLTRIYGNILESIFFSPICIKSNTNCIISIISGVAVCFKSKIDCINTNFRPGAAVLISCIPYFIPSFHSLQRKGQHKYVLPVDFYCHQFYYYAGSHNNIVTLSFVFVF